MCTFSLHKSPWQCNFDGETKNVSSRHVFTKYLLSRHGWEPLKKVIYHIYNQKLRIPSALCYRDESTLNFDQYSTLRWLVNFSRKWKINWDYKTRNILKVLNDNNNITNIWLLCFATATLISVFCELQIKNLMNILSVTNKTWVLFFPFY